MNSVKILVYYGKYGEEYWLANTKEQLKNAQRALFNMLDEQGYYYDENQDHLEKARRGNIVYIRGILESRQCFEYEQWHIEEVFAVEPAKFSDS